MLSKLLKHELRATARFLLPVYIIVLLASVLNRIVLRLELFKSGALIVVPGFMTVTYIASIAAVVVVTFVIMVMRFYKNLLSDEGYLMFTLPVKSHQLITSKLLISILWNLSSIILVLCSLWIVFGTSKNMQGFWTLATQMYEELNMAFGGNTVLLVVEFLLMLALGLLQNILMIYVAIAIGQLFNGHKLLGSFVAYIGVYMVAQTVISLFMLIGWFLFKTSLQDMQSIPRIVFPFSIIMAAVFNVVYYFVTDYIFRRKLNLE